jgi:colanic acid/amylovoran biosynthesis protein
MNSDGPRVLMEPSDYVLRNLGDMAMLSVAVERLDAGLPGVTIQVLTDQPEALKTFCPLATPLDASSRHLWLNTGFLETLVNDALPPRLANRVQRRIPHRVATLVESYLFRRSEFMRALSRSDLVVVAGMGGITDYFPNFCADLLKTMQLAVSAGKPVAMVGQGMGPLENSDLRKLARAILPQLDLIALREHRAGVPLLHELGVDPSRIIVTGDDALELAFKLQLPKLGEGVGLNLRLSDYSAIDAASARMIGNVVHQIAIALGAPLIPLPVSRVPGESDIATLRLMMPDCDEELKAATKISTPEGLVRQIQRCRLVIAGSYHAGVFALANGIPTIGVAASSYYVDKFEGLKDLFREGCAVVRLDRKNYLEDLRSAVERLWSTADATRSHLLSSAERQISAHYAAYSKIAELVVQGRQGAKLDERLQ